MSHSMWSPPGPGADLGSVGAAFSARQFCAMRGFRHARGAGRTGTAEDSNCIELQGIFDQQDPEALQMGKCWFRTTEFDLSLE